MTVCRVTRVIISGMCKVTRKIVFERKGCIGIERVYWGQKSGCEGGEGGGLLYTCSTVQGSGNAVRVQSHIMCMVGQWSRACAFDFSNTSSSDARHSARW